MNIDVDWSKAPKEAIAYCHMEDKWKFPGQWLEDCCIPRPESATEWDGEGLPPIGDECEFYTVRWRVGKVLCYVDGRHGKQGIVQFDDDWQCFCPEDVPERVRPIRTKAERDREELCEIASKYSDLGHVIADDILAAGWQKP